MSRNESGLKKALEQIQSLKDEFQNDFKDSGR